jgi:hypothetical protein
VKRFVRAAIALVILAPGCTQILGLNDQHDDAIADFCACPEVQKALGEPDCATFLGNKLALASEEDRAAWLTAYSKDCDSCLHYHACFYMVPICARQNEPCNGEAECCAFSKGTAKGVCSNGKCME